MTEKLLKLLDGLKNREVYADVVGSVFCRAYIGVVRDIGQICSGDNENKLESIGVIGDAQRFEIEAEGILNIFTTNEETGMDFEEDEGFVFNLEFEDATNVYFFDITKL